MATAGVAKRACGGFSFSAHNSVESETSRCRVRPSPQCRHPLCQSGGGRSCSCWDSGVCAERSLVARAAHERLVSRRRPRRSCEWRGRRTWEPSGGWRALGGDAVRVRAVVRAAAGVLPRLLAARPAGDGPAAALGAVVGVLEPCGHVGDVMSVSGVGVVVGVQVACAVVGVVLSVMWFPSGVRRLRRWARGCSWRPGRPCSRRRQPRGHARCQGCHRRPCTRRSRASVRRR